MKEVLAVALKEWLHIIRDRRAFLLTLIFPAFTVVFLGSAITLDIKNLKIAVYDEDRGISRQIVEKLEGSPFFLLREVSTLPEGEALLNEGKITTLLWFKKDFTNSIQRRGSPEVYITMDGSNNNSALITQGYLLSLLEGDSLSFKFLFNPSLDSRKFFVPGIIAIFLFILSVAMTALSIVKERENGTIEGLLASPLPPHKVIFGKVLPYFLTGICDFSIALLFAWIAFGIKVEGNLLELYLATGLFVICGVSIGLFISTITESTMSAWLISFIITVLPSLILSDFVFPTRSMPSFIEGISFLVPTKYYMKIIRHVILKGTELSLMRAELFPLFGFSCFFLLASLRGMKRMVS